MGHVHSYQETRRNMQENEEDGNVIPHQCKLKKKSWKPKLYF